MRIQKRHVLGIFLPALLFLFVLAMDNGILAFISFPMTQDHLREFVLGAAFICLLFGMFRMDWFRERTLIHKLRFLGICMVGLWVTVKLLSVRSLPTAYSSNNPASSAVYPFNNLYWMALFLALTIFSIWIFVLLKELIYVQQAKKTHLNFTLLVVFILFHMIYALAGGEEIKLISFDRFGSYRYMFPNTICFPFVLLLAFINGFRCKWIHYLNKRQKIGFFIYFMLVAPFAVHVLFMTGNTVHNYSLVIGAYTRCLFVVYLIYSAMSLIGILSLLPSAGLLDRKIREIQSLQTLSSTIGSVFDREELIAKTTELAMKVVNADFTWLELKDGIAFQLSGTHGIKSEAIERIPDEVRKAIRSESMRGEEALLINDINKSKKTKEIKKWGRKAGSLLAAPLLIQRKERGILYAVKRETFGFVEESRALFQSFADQVAVALENAHLVQVTIDQEVYREELRVAHEAQMRILPQTMPEIEGIELDAFCATANEIGGDFYDLIPVGEDRMDIVVGDVSGKGASAAFYMAELKGVIQALAPHFTSPKKILVEVNGFLKNHFEPDTFVTMVYGILLPQAKQIKLVRAGHPPVGWIRQKKVEWIEPKGLGLGLAHDASFTKSLQEKVLHLKKGDIVFFYTDGVSEARNDKGDEYGEEVLTETLLDLHSQGAQEILTEIRRRLDTFTRGVPRHDDVTLLAMRMLK